MEVNEHAAGKKIVFVGTTGMRQDLSNHDQAVPPKSRMVNQFPILRLGTIPAPATIPTLDLFLFLAHFHE